MTDPRMTPTNDAPVTVEPAFLLMKRGLFYRPGNAGYTGIKADAGRYNQSEADELSGVTAIHENDAPMFAPACWEDVKVKHLLGIIAERDRSLAALASAPAEPRLNPTPIEALADTLTGKTEVDRLAITLMRAFGKAEPKEGISQHPVSYVATFADMARAVIASAPAGGEIDQAIDAEVARVMAMSDEDIMRDADVDGVRATIASAIACAEDRPKLYLYEGAEGQWQTLASADGERAQQLRASGYLETPLFTRLASAPAGDGVVEAAFKEGIATGYQCGKADENTTDEWHAAWLASDASVAAALARPRAAVGEREA